MSKAMENQTARGVEATGIAVMCFNAVFLSLLGHIQESRTNQT